MSKSYTGIDVIACVQGNTARSFDSVRYNDGSVKEHRDCVVLNFRGMTSGSSYSDGNETTRRRAIARKKAARAMIIMIIFLMKFLIKGKLLII